MLVIAKRLYEMVLILGIDIGFSVKKLQGVDKKNFTLALLAGKLK